MCAALKVLAAGNSFQDVATFSGMSVTTAETSFHHFCKKFSAALWDKWVKLPVGDELKKVEEVFRRSGYPGAVGSMDSAFHQSRAQNFLRPIMSVQQK